MKKKLYTFIGTVLYSTTIMAAPDRLPDDTPMSFGAVIFWLIVIVGIIFYSVISNED